VSTIAGVTIPAESFVLCEPLQGPEFRAEIVPSVSLIEDDPSILAWTTCDEFERMDDAIRACSSVGDVELLAAFDQASEWLYRFEWTPQEPTALPLLAAPDAAVLGARAREDWTVRMLFGAREDLSDGYEACREAGVDAEIDWIQTVEESDRLGRFCVTPCQLRALEAAYRRGYYEIPRGVTLEELSDELGVSHQALSERFCRAHRSLIQAVLSGVDPATLGGGFPEKVQAEQR